MRTTIEHPPFCPGYGCDDPGGGDIVHQEMPKRVLAPASDPYTAIAVALARSDELDRDGRQVVHAVEAVLTAGEVTVWLTLDELRELLEQGRETMVRAWQAATAVPRFDPQAS